MTLVLPIAAYSPSIPSSHLGEDSTVYSNWNTRRLDNKETTQITGKHYSQYLVFSFYLQTGIHFHKAGIHFHKVGVGNLICELFSGFGFYFQLFFTYISKTFSKSTVCATICNHLDYIEREMA